MLTCSDARKGGCKGEVTQWLRPSDWTSWPKCETHLDEAQAEFERIEATYGVTSDVAPAWFDPADAGESFDEV